MAKRYKKLKNPEFTIFIESFLGHIEPNKSVLGFDSAKVAELENDNAELKAALLSIKNLQDMLDSKIQSVKTIRAKMDNSVEKFEKNAANNETVSKSLMELLGFDIKTQHFGIPGISVPIELFVNGTSDGINHLKFNRNANRQGTNFIIEAKIADSTSWVIIDVITNTKYDHKNQTPGVRVQYRVRAKRGELESTASNIATVYG